MTVNVLEAKTKLSELIRRAEKGEEVIIARAGVPAIRLTPYTEPPTAKRKLGEFQGRVFMSDDFNDALPDEILESFYQ